AAAAEAHQLCRAQRTEPGLALADVDARGACDDLVGDGRARDREHLQEAALEGLALRDALAQHLFELRSPSGAGVPAASGPHQRREVQRVTLRLLYERVVGDRRRRALVLAEVRAEQLRLAVGEATERDPRRPGEELRDAGR